MPSLFVCVAALFTLVIPTGHDDLVQRELKRLHGTWVPVDIQHDGGKVTPEEPLKWVFRDDRCEVWLGKGKAETQELKLDPTWKPATVEIRPPGGVMGHRIKGIYEFDGEQLRICYDLTGKQFPKEFTAPKGARRIVYVMRRE